MTRHWEHSLNLTALPIVLMLLLSSHALLAASQDDKNAIGLRNGTCRVPPRSRALFVGREAD